MERRDLRYEEEREKGRDPKPNLSKGLPVTHNATGINNSVVS